MRLDVPNSTHEIQDAFLALCQAAATLTPTSFLPGERQALGGHLQPCARELVALVADALSAAPDLYAGLPAGAELRERQAEADAWLRLRAVASRIERVAADRHLRAQSDAARGATAVLDFAFAPPRPGAPPDPLDRLRRDGLLPAQLVRAAYLRRIHKKGRPAPSPARKPALTPRGREHSRALLHQVFTAALRRNMKARVTNLAPAITPFSQPPSPSPIASDAKNSAPSPLATAQAGQRTDPTRPTPRTAPAPAQAAPATQEHEPTGDPMPTTLAPPGPKERFLAFLTGTRPGAQRPVAAMATPQLLELQGKTADLCARAQAPQFSEKIRAQLQGKRSPVLGDALELCGLGLAARGTFATKIGISQAECKDAAGRDGAFTRLAKASGDLYQCAGQAAAQVADKADADAEAVLQAVAAFATDESKDLTARIAFEDGFAEALRLREEARLRDERRGRRKELRLRPLRAAIAEAKAGAEEARQLDRFLTDQRKGPDTF